MESFGDELRDIIAERVALREGCDAVTTPARLYGNSVDSSKPIRKRKLSKS
jgi:hypothetical protein